MGAKQSKGADKGTDAGNGKPDALTAASSSASAASSGATGAPHVTRTSASTPVLVEGGGAGKAAAVSATGVATPTKSPVQGSNSNSNQLGSPATGGTPVSASKGKLVVTEEEAAQRAQEEGRALLVVREVYGAKVAFNFTSAEWGERRDALNSMMVTIDGIRTELAEAAAAAQDGTGNSDPAAAAAATADGEDSDSGEIFPNAASAATSLGQTQEQNVLLFKSVVVLIRKALGDNVLPVCFAAMDCFRSLMKSYGPLMQEADVAPVLSTIVPSLLVRMGGESTRANKRMQREACRTLLRLARTSQVGGLAIIIPYLSMETMPCRARLALLRLLVNEFQFNSNQGLRLPLVTSIAVPALGNANDKTRKAAVGVLVATYEVVGDRLIKHLNNVKPATYKLLERKFHESKVKRGLAPPDATTSASGSVATAAGGVVESSSAPASPGRQKPQGRRRSGGSTLSTTASAGALAPVRAPSGRTAPLRERPRTVIGTDTGAAAAKSGSGSAVGAGAAGPGMQGSAVAAGEQNVPMQRAVSAPTHSPVNDLNDGVLAAGPDVTDLLLDQPAVAEAPNQQPDEEPQHHGAAAAAPTAHPDPLEQQVSAKALHVARVFDPAVAGSYGNGGNIPPHMAGQASAMGAENSPAVRYSSFQSDIDDAIFDELLAD